MVSKRNKLLIVTCFVGLVLLLLILSRSKLTEGFEQPLQGISDGWYINLDRSPERKKQVEEETKKLGTLRVQRWKAVEGSALTPSDYAKHNIPAWSRPGFAKDEKKRKGELGAALSHKTLLQHLNTLQVSPDSGHLILEDDIVIDKDMPAVWNKALKSIGAWDIIFIGLLGNTVKDVKDGIGIPEWITGTHAYVVKHSSIPKIIDSLKVIYDPIDEMYGRNLKSLKIFALEPSKIKQANQPSTIV
jgi:GR25 family glycosyltransferase involved in LPS biosynthesis